MTQLEERRNTITSKRETRKDWFTKYEIAKHLSIPVNGEGMSALLAEAPVKPNTRECFKACPHCVVVMFFLGGCLHSAVFLRR